MSAIRCKVLNDRAFPQMCYRTLVVCKGRDFLGISVGCSRFLQAGTRKNVIGLKKYVYTWLIRLKKCDDLSAIRWEKCNFAIERI